MKVLIKDGKNGNVFLDNIMYYSYFRNWGIYVLLCNGIRIFFYLKFVWV